MLSYDEIAELTQEYQEELEKAAGETSEEE
jgi:hypothetical protein